MEPKLEVIHWSKISLRGVNQEVCMEMFLNEGFRTMVNCRLYAESIAKCPKRNRLVIFDVSYVERVIYNHLVKPLNQDLEMIVKLIDLANKNLRDSKGG